MQPTPRQCSGTFGIENELVPIERRRGRRRREYDVKEIPLGCVTGETTHVPKCIFGLNVILNARSIRKAGDLTNVAISIDEKERRARTLDQAEQDLVDRQLQSMYVFDALIYNEDRHAGNILYTPSDWRVHLIDHTRAFRTKTNRPDALRDVSLTPSPELARGIAELDQKALRDEMKGLLHAMQVSSIVKRRKKLVAEWTKQGLLSETPVAAAN